MSITEEYFTIGLVLKGYEFIVNGEQKSLLKFYIHPNSVHEERSISKLSRTDQPKVANINRKPLNVTEKFVEIEKEMLDTISDTIFSDMLSAVIPEKNQEQLIPADRMAGIIILLARKEVAETADKFRNKSVLIALNIEIVTLKLPLELMKEMEENVRRNNNGSIPASSGSIEELERVKLEQNALEKCVICFKEILAGSTMIRTGCSHEFHAKCITEWFSNINLCPRCRFEMPSGVLDSFLY